MERLAFPGIRNAAPSVWILTGRTVPRSQHARLEPSMGLPASKLAHRFAQIVIPLWAKYVSAFSPQPQMINAKQELDFAQATIPRTVSTSRIRFAHWERHSKMENVWEWPCQFVRLGLRSMERIVSRSQILHAIRWCTALLTSLRSYKCFVLNLKITFPLMSVVSRNMLRRKLTHL